MTNLGRIMSSVFYSRAVAGYHHRAYGEEGVRLRCKFPQYRWFVDLVKSQGFQNLLEHDNKGTTSGSAAATAAQAAGSAADCGSRSTWTRPSASCSELPRPGFQAPTQPGPRQRRERGGRYRFLYDVAYGKFLY